ncbi:4'-phosphopantetheinyl transferase family protein [Streptomyces sp. NPDC058855]|uniref:4'-phosphopantetheinyl transferase family protein n=1 Tax=Streptomyces sp. NPDC058855 TaxID=3346651 RepID=UPI0036BCB35B
MTLEPLPVRALRAGETPDVDVPPVAGGTVVSLWLVRVAPDPGAYDLLDAGERARWSAFVREEDRARYLAAHGALRRLLGRFLDVRPEEVVLAREPCPLCGATGREGGEGGGEGGFFFFSPEGRVFFGDDHIRALPALPAAVHFSLSHSGDLVLLGLGARPLGVDVEGRPAVSVADTVAGSLHPVEGAELAALPPEERPAAFARCWARKEAYLKGTGAGLAGGVDRTYVGTGPAPASIQGWSLADVPVPSGFAAAVAVAASAPLPRPGTPSDGGSGA